MSVLPVLLRKRNEGEKEPKMLSILALIFTENLFINKSRIIGISRLSCLCKFTSSVMLIELFVEDISPKRLPA